ncbi:hypothetical protein [Rhodospirillaceae bacterium SYSU D60014]|uniref:hypothetical protein n=1 Tax=Virgifigura deserti TaxID=2268457 RepID=UPI000E66C5C1
MMQLLAGFTLSILLALPAMASEWTVTQAPADDVALRAAKITNEDGNTLYLWPRHSDDTYQIIAEVHLGDGSGFAGAMPSYRIDGGETIDTDVVRRAGESKGALWGHVGGKVAFWKAWSSDDDVIKPTDPFNAWLAGETLRFTYHAASGGTNTTAFPLHGLDAAVSEATGVRVP